MASNTEKRITAKMVLDSSGFNSSLKGVNAELKNAQSQMKLASSGIQAFGKDSEKLKSVQEALSKQVELHSQKVGIYTQSIEKTKSKLEDNIKVRDKLKENLSKAESQLKKVIDTHGKELQGYIKNKEELSKLNKEYEIAKKRYGENSTEANKLKEQISKLENEQKKLTAGKEKEVKAYEKAKTEVDKTTKEYEKNEKAIDSNAKKIQQYDTNLNKAQSQMNKAQGELKKINEELDKQNNKWVSASNRLKDHSEKLKNTGKEITDVGKGINKLSLPIAAVGIGSAKAAIDFESAFTGVKKTVEGTDEQFAQLSKGIRNMSKEMPQSAVEISGVAEAAGQLGIKTENIQGFTKSMVMLGDSTNMSSEQAATSLARLANITQMPQTEFDKLGSVIVHLGNNLATTESEIVEMGLRLAGAGKQIGLTEAQTLGLSGALSSVGIEAEMGGSAISKVMVKMQAAATIGSDQAKKLSQATGMSMRELELLASNNGKAFKEVADSLNMTTAEMNAVIKSSKELDNFGKIAGMTGEQFKEAFQKDASTALIAFIRGLGNAENAGTSAIEMLEEMGIKEVRLRDSLLRAANAGTLLEDSINMGTKAWGENIALTNEANQRYETTESKLKMARNQIVDAGISIGNNLLPALRDIAVSVAGMTEKFSHLSPEMQKGIVKFGAFVAITGPTIVGIGKVITGFGSIVSFGSKVAGIMGKVTLATKGVEVASVTAGATMATTGAKTGLLSTAFSGVKGAGGLAASGVVKLAGALGMSVPVLGIAVAGVAA
ncbi:phage tail tape measure protein, partial [Clostridium botulinum]|uniref:phage tail tape measure protein n=1 Tax=Clostridium botulinum TaxID=1491 RepID=UPI0012B690A5